MSRTIHGLAITALSLAMACVGRLKAADEPGTALPVQAHHVVGYQLARDSALARQGLGALKVIVRVLDRPEDVLTQTRVSILSAFNTGRSITSYQTGTTRFDSLPVGRYRVGVYRIGYRPALVTIDITPGCEERLEAYLPLHPICDYGCALSSPRATITTCWPEA
jgi:hypothetical protein